MTIWVKVALKLVGFNPPASCSSSGKVWANGTGVGVHYATTYMTTILV